MVCEWNFAIYGSLTCACFLLLLKNSVYRFLRMPSFWPSLVIRLVVSPDGTGTLVAKRTNSQVEDENAPREQTLPISSEQVNDFLNLLHEADFWSLPTAKSMAFGGQAE